MGIVVYWQEEPSVPAMASFPSTQLTQALKWCEVQRAAEKTHVCISSELEESVGKAGVNAVEGKVLPDGRPYEWTKARRGAGPQSSSGT